MSRAPHGEPSIHIRIRDRIAFRLERLVLRGVGYRLGLAAAIIFLVALGGGLLAVWLVADAPGEAIWWAFLRLSDPGYLGDDEGVALRTISTIVTVLGYVLFLGLLVAIMTQWLNAKIEYLESGVTPIALRDHVIVFGWTARTPDIVRGLLTSRPRVERFLTRIGARSLRIVVLVEELNEGLRQEMRERLGDLWSDRAIFLRSGSALRADHLERVAYRDASVLILPGADFGEDRPEAVDAKTIKELLSISRTADHTPPLAVAEFFDVRHIGTARRAYKGESEIIAVDDIVSRIIAQSTRQRGLCTVYSELLTLNDRSSIYVRAIDGFTGVSFEDARRRFPNAILIGTTPAGQGAPNLAPSPDTRIEPDNLLVFVARRYDDTVPSTTGLPASPMSPRAPRTPGQIGHRRMLILGWSRKIATLLWELDRQFSDGYEVDVVSSTPVETRERLLQFYESEDRRLPVRHVEADFRIPRVLEQLEPAAYDSILILASERSSAEEEADATTTVAYLMLQDLLPTGVERPNVLIELLDPGNAVLFENVSDDVMVSSALVSFLLSQIALHRELAAVIRELTRPWGPQILLEPADQYVDITGPLTFEEIERAAAARGEIALGLKRRVQPDAGLILNPDRDVELNLRPEDAVVLLSTVAVPRGVPEQPA